MGSKEIMSVFDWEKQHNDPKKDRESKFNNEEHQILGIPEHLFKKYIKEWKILNKI